MKIVKGFANFLLILLSIIILLILTISLVLKRELSTTSIKSTLDQVGTNIIINNLEQKSNGLENNAKEILDEVGIPDDIISKTIHSSATKDFINTYLSRSISSFFQKNQEAPITKEDLLHFVSGNFQEIEKELTGSQKKFIEQNENKIYQYIDKKGDDIVTLLPTTEEILEKQGDTVIQNGLTLNDIKNLSSKFISNTFLFCLIGLYFLIFILLGALNYKTFAWLKYTSIISLFYSIFTFMVIVGLVIIKNLNLEMQLGSFYEIVVYLINRIIQSLWIGIIIGILLSIIFYIIYRKIKKRLTKKAK